MPAYGGGKSRLGKEILSVIEKYEEKYDWSGDYFEPFCGLLGVGIHVAESGRRVTACDANKDLILMWKALKRGWSPPKSCSKKYFESLKNSKKHSAERGFAGFSCAYSGIFFAGYRVSDSSGRNFFKKSRDGIMEMTEYLDKVKFLPASDYKKFSPKGCTIYCDPPYKNNNFKSEHFSDFDHDEFWDTMRIWSKHNLVFISEYKAPKDFKVIWKKKVNNIFSSQVKKQEEKLFMYRYT